MSFAALKARSQNSVGTLQKRLEETSKKKGFTKDERYWKPTRDDNGNALAVIRFLPAPEGEELSYVTYWDHSFDVDKRYYIERSLTTLGQEDPVGESNRILWDQGEGSEGREIARKRKRKLHYVANIYVEKDSNAPENNGKVFLYDFGTKIFEKIKSLAQPDFEDETPIDAFNMFEGASFRLKVKKQGEFPNYDDSAFIEAKPFLNGDEAKMEAVYNKLYSLEAEVAPDKFKSYEDLKKKLDYVLNGNSSSKSASQKVEDELNQEAGTNDDFDLINKNVRKETPKEDSDDNDFSLDLNNFNIGDDEIPF